MRFGQDCGVRARFWRNFADKSTADQGILEPDVTVWLNVDAYMCPWRYSLLHSLSTGKPMVLSFFDERPAKSVQEILSTPQRFAASFGEEQRSKCDEMAGTLYGFKWLAHKANQDWNLTKQVNTALVDVFLPAAPNQFTVQDKQAPRYTDPSTLVTRPLGLNEWLVRRYSACSVPPLESGRFGCKCCRCCSNNYVVVLCHAVLRSPAHHRSGCGMTNTSVAQGSNRSARRAQSKFWPKIVLAEDTKSYDQHVLRCLAACGNEISCSRTMLLASLLARERYTGLARPTPIHVCASVRPAFGLGTNDRGKLSPLKPTPPPS